MGYEKQKCLGYCSFVATTLSHSFDWAIAHALNQGDEVGPRL